MVIAAASPPVISLRGPSQCQYCQEQGFGCSTSYGITNNWSRSPFDQLQRSFDQFETSFRFKNPFFGGLQFQMFPTGHKICPSRVSVAADFSDSVPDASTHVGLSGYHPLEELNDHKRVRETKLTHAEIAKTTLEANSRALLIFPGTVHCEPHEQMSWVEYQYVIDEYGDIFFEIPDDVNILQDREASNAVNVVIGMDVPIFKNGRLGVTDFSISESDFFDDDSFEVENYDGSDILKGSEMTDSSSLAHPIYFAKCLTKAVNTEYAKRMDYPSNGISLLGCLRPTFVDEQFYLQRLFIGEELEDSEGYTSDMKDGELLSFESRGDANCSGSLIYRLEIMRLELLSAYGVQSEVNLREFRDAEPDDLVHSAAEIVESFSEKRASFHLALAALCKKSGLRVEAATLIGVDSMGIDVRVFTGREVQTHRFPFKARATSELAAEKQIQQLLFPRSRRKRIKARTDAVGQDLD